MARSRSKPALAPLAESRGWTLAVEIAALLVALWLAGHVIYLTQYGTRVLNGDVKEYRSYALAFWTVAPLFRHLPVEYPPLAIFPFTLTLLPPIPDATDVFAVWMSGVVVLSYLWVRRSFSREQAVAFAVLLLVGANGTVLARYDLFPALATLGALWALRERRFTWAYVLLAIGILLKLYPVFLVPVAAIEHWRALRAPRQTEASGRGPRVADWLCGAWDALLAEARTPAVRRAGLGMLLCAVVVAATFGVAALLSPAGAFSGFVYESNRPLQIESVPASILWLGTFFGQAAHAVYSFQSLNYVGPLDAVLRWLSTLGLIAGCLYVYWRQARGKLHVGQAMVACLCVVLVANKVFSPQYLVWVLPLVAVVDGVDWLWLAVGVLTTFIYPFLYFDHSHINQVAGDWRFLPVVALRNALLVVIAVRAVRGLRGTPLLAGAAAPSASSRKSRIGRAEPKRQVSAGIS